MSTPNLYGREAFSSDMFLGLCDSATQRTGFSNFLSEYKLVCDDNWTLEQILRDAERRWSEMSLGQRERFSPKDGLANSSSDDPIQGSSLKSDAVDGEQLVDAYDRATPAMSDTSCACGDGGFGEFLEEYTLKAAEQAARYWDNMSSRERAEYAPQLLSDSSFSSFATDAEQFVNVDDPVSAAMSNDTMFGSCGPKKMKCAKPKKKSCSKPKKRSASKPKCPKPKAARRCPKPKAAKRSPKPKPRCPKMCPKPKSAKRCPKPKPVCPITCMQPEAPKSNVQEPMTKEN